MWVEVGRTIWNPLLPQRRRKRSNARLTEAGKRGDGSHGVPRPRLKLQSVVKDHPVDVYVLGAGDLLLVRLYALKHASLQRLRRG